ncbi:hypothetical protein FRC12_011298 [Ceratobasidium sp. 428]|nr:hypothetical protein FRC12_011298 [Ceratobasidium sp. 428]
MGLVLADPDKLDEGQRIINDRHGEESNDIRAEAGLNEIRDIVEKDANDPVYR